MVSKLTPAHFSAWLHLSLVHVKYISFHVLFTVENGVNAEFQ